MVFNKFTCSNTAVLLQRKTTNYAIPHRSNHHRQIIHPHNQKVPTQAIHRLLHPRTLSPFNHRHSAAAATTVPTAAIARTAHRRLSNRQPPLNNNNNSPAKYQAISIDQLNPFLNHRNNNDNPLAEPIHSPHHPHRKLLVRRRLPQSATMMNLCQSFNPHRFQLN